MSVTLLIDTINRAKSPIEVFSNLSNWLSEYKKIVKQIHPDVCHVIGAKEALTKLNSYKDELEKGKNHIDDAGTITYNINKINIIGQQPILEVSLKNYNKLLAFKEKIDIDFQRYIPISAKLENKDSLTFDIDLRRIPISSLGILPQCHVNWILSRMLEFAAYLYQKGYSHAGINPDSVYIEPVNHGINVISFYHMSELGKKISTASGKYLYMYPDHVKINKITTPDIDVELCKRTAIYLLGDKSGIGTCLRKTHNIPFLDFISKRHNNPVDAFLDYREMLSKNFEKKFIPFII